MGTRNLTIVFMGGEYRVAQYGQWDGYPEGQGMTCLKFLRDEIDEVKFITRLSQFQFVEGNEDVERRIDKAFDKGIGGFVFPEFSRDTCADILPMIQNGTATTRYLGNSIDFASKSLFCEWAWLVDFDKRTFEAYQGFNTTPLTPDDRFYFLRDKEDHGYHGVKLVASWPLDNLPTDEEFLSAFKEDDE